MTTGDKVKNSVSRSACVTKYSLKVKKVLVLKSSLKIKCVSLKLKSLKVIVFLTLTRKYKMLDDDFIIYDKKIFYLEDLGYFS